jgi:hypothetical protein
VTERHIIICTRIADLPVPYAPARQALCSVCGHDVWLGYAVLRDVPDGEPTCEQCVRLTIPPDAAVYVTPEVRRETAAILRRRRN